MFNYRQKLIARSIKEFDQVLDIGFAEIPNQFLKNKELIGIDLQNVSKPANYSKVIIGNANDLNLFFEESSIEAICSGELFEHLLNPIDFLKKCHFILKPDGFIVISTPNPHHLIEFVSTLFLSRKFFYDPEHVCIYPQRWLIRMLELSGFTDVKLRSGGISVPLIGDLWFPRPIAEYSLVTARALK